MLSRTFKKTASCVFTAKHEIGHTLAVPLVISLRHQHCLNSRVLWLSLYCNHVQVSNLQDYGNFCTIFLQSFEVFDKNLIDSLLLVFAKFCFILFR
jgi:hypothetical protein